MSSTEKDEKTTLNDACGRVPLSPSKIPISPNRRIAISPTSTNRHLLHNCETLNNDHCDTTAVRDGAIAATYEPISCLNTHDEINQEIECTNANKRSLYSSSSANCSSSQHDSRFKCHQANNAVILRHPHVTNDGHKYHRSLSPPASHGNVSSANTTGASTTNSLNRVSLQQLSSGKKAIRIKLYRNGDKFFKGIIYPLSTERIRSFNAFLEDLTRILVDQVSGAICSLLARVLVSLSVLGKYTSVYLKLDVSNTLLFTTSSCHQCSVILPFSLSHVHFFPLLSTLTLVFALPLSSILVMVISIHRTSSP